MKNTSKAPGGDYSVLGLNYFPLALGLFSCEVHFGYSRELWL